ncbi:MAG: hypothetical protein V4808_13890 [Pseudomonadota bacterium]
MTQPTRWRCGGSGQWEAKALRSKRDCRKSTKPIFDFEQSGIETVIDNPEDLAELIQRLEQIKGMLPPKKKYDLWRTSPA